MKRLLATGVLFFAAILSGRVAMANTDSSCDGAQKPGGKPFVKWAGGKSQLIPQLTALLPGDLAERKDLIYVEPFVGGGAMLFHVLEHYPNIRRAVINDLNSDLVTAYKVVKSRPDELIAALRLLQENYRACKDEQARKELYLSKRDRYNSGGNGEVETAALFIFLNRTCFNGLYRVNSKGKFNVPFGKAVNPLICDEKTIRADSALLQKAEIMNGDFEAVRSAVKGKAFFYFDPPYRPLTVTAAFTCGVLPQPGQGRASLATVQLRPAQRQPRRHVLRGIVLGVRHQPRLGEPRHKFEGRRTGESQRTGNQKLRGVRHERL